MDRTLDTFRTALEGHTAEALNGFSYLTGNRMAQSLQWVLLATCLTRA